jgi:hypothetical protein
MTQRMSEEQGTELLRTKLPLNRANYPEGFCMLPASTRGGFRHSFSAGLALTESPQTDWRPH